MTDNPSPADHPNLKQAVEIAIRLALLVALIGWCFTILSPFLPFLFWIVFMPVRLQPIFLTVNRKLGNRNGLTATLLVIFILIILLVPCILLTDSLIDGVRHLKETYDQDGHLIPPPDERVKSWPAFMKPVVDLWTLASNSLQA